MRKDQIQVIVIEFVSIVFAVLLALWVNTAAADHKSQVQLNIALENIKSEITKNKGILETRYQYHKAMADSFRALLLDQESRRKKRRFLGLPQMGFDRGFGFETLHNIAWETAKTSGAISEADYTLLLQLSSLYETQESLKGIEEKATSYFFLFMEDYRENPDEYWSLIRLEPIVFWVPSLEKALLQSYEAIEKKQWFGKLE